MFGLVDANNFFASCEQAFNPGLRGRPVVVLSNNDGCIIARSREAKDLGIKMGEPYFKVKNFLERHDVKVFSANYSLYGDMSRRIMLILMEFVPDIEVYSIDEAFIRLDTVVAPQIEDFVNDLSNKIFKWTSIPVTIGVGKTKTLAKLATEYAKKVLHQNVLILDDRAFIEKVMRQTAIEDLWGIGRRWARKMYQNFVYTVWDFVQLSDSFIRKNFNVLALRLKYELMGQSVFGLNDMPEGKKSIRRSRSFGVLIEKYDDLEEAISNFADGCAVKLRTLDEVANMVMVYLRTDPHRDDLPQYRNSITIPLSSPTNSSRIIIGAALKGLRSIYKEGYKYRKAGVLALGLEPAISEQVGLFDPYNKAEEHSLMKVIDGVRKKYGRNILYFGTQIGEGNWKPRQFHISQQFTTNWDELLKVK